MPSRIQGGNALKVTLLDYSTNLHSVWDSGLIFNLLKESYGDSQVFKTTIYYGPLTLCPMLSNLFWTQAVKPPECLDSVSHVGSLLHAVYSHCLYQDAWESDLLSRVSVNGQWHEMAQKWKNCPDGSLACTAPYAGTEFFFQFPLLYVLDPFCLFFCDRLSIHRY